MQRLLTAAAGGATASACAGGQPERPTVDIQGTSVAVTTPTGSAASVGELPPKPPPSASPPDHGYLVVDMLPPPAACANVAATIGVTAQWKPSKAGMIIEVKLGKPGFPGAQYAGGAITASQGSLRVVKQAADAIALELSPVAGQTSFYLLVPIQCSAGQSHVEVDSGQLPAAKNGAAVPLSLVDTY